MHVNKDEIMRSVHTALSGVSMTDLHNEPAGDEALRVLFDIMAEDDIVQKTMLIISRPDVITEIKGMVPNDIHADVETYNFRDEYEIVVCLDVLQYLRDPIGFIHKLARVTGDKLIIEVASVGDRYQYGTRSMRWYEKYVLKRLPVILVGKGIPIAQKRSSAHKYFFTPGALENILLNHTKIFSGVDVIDTKSKNRSLAVAKKKYIEHLLIVSGPTASGKSTFLDNLRDESLPGHIVSLLDKDAHTWPQTSGKIVVRETLKTIHGKEIVPDKINGLALHYDILRPLSTRTVDYYRDPTLDVLRCAKNITVIILRNDPADLINQFNEGELTFVTVRHHAVLLYVKKFVKILSGIIPKYIKRSVRSVSSFENGISEISNVPQKKDTRYHQRLLEKYKVPGWLDVWYERWESYLVNNYKNVSVHTVKWPPERAL